MCLVCLHIVSRWLRTTLNGSDDRERGREGEREERGRMKEGGGEGEGERGERGSVREGG